MNLIPGIMAPEALSGSLALSSWDEIVFLPVVITSLKITGVATMLEQPFGFLAEREQ